MSGFGDLGTQQWLTRELLQFYDELTALHACNAFLLQAMASTLIEGEGLDERSANGAVYCTQWLNDRASELERRLKSLQSTARSSATTDACSDMSRGQVSHDQCDCARPRILPKPIRFAVVAE